jgi:hypothetical protein
MDAENVRIWAEELKKKLGGRNVVVFIDTWQRATSTASQNDDKEMQKAIAHAEAIARFLDGVAIIAFHPPKGRDDTISGSMILENSTTAILNITEVNGGEKKLQVVRIKGHKEGAYAYFKIKEHGISQWDKQLNEITGALPEYIGGTGMGHAQERVIADADARAEIVSIHLNTLRTRKQPLTMKEIAITIERALDHGGCKDTLKNFFPNTRKAVDIEKMLTRLFTANDEIPVAGSMDIVKCIKGNLVYINGERSPSIG